MNGCRSLLLQVTFVAALLAVFGGAWWLCDHVFRLDSPFPIFVAAGTLFAVFAGLGWWAIGVRSKEDEVIGMLEHPFFGTVKQRRTSWETIMTVPNIGSEIAISSYGGNQPTCNQQEIIEWSNSSINSVREELESSLDAFDTLPPRPRNLVFESLLLDPIAPKTFCLGFDIKEADLAWGFSASYTDGELEEFTDDH